MAVYMNEPHVTILPQMSGEHTEHDLRSCPIEDLTIEEGNVLEDRNGNVVGKIFLGEVHLSQEWVNSRFLQRNECVGIEVMMTDKVEPHFYKEEE